MSVYVIASPIPPAHIVPSLAFGPFGGLLGASSGPLGGLLGFCWSLFGASWRSLVGFGGPLGASWAPRGAEGSICLFRFLVWASSLGCPGAILGRVGGLLGRLGGLLGRLGAIRGAYRGLLDVCLDIVGGLSGVLGASFEASWGRLGASFRASSEASWGP